jgi:hypothetical protein
VVYLKGFRHFSARIELLSCLNKYPTRILLICLAAAFTLATSSCDRNEGNQQDTRAFSADERYLIEAYLDIKNARSYYPRSPAVAESLFTVLDSTIDSVRIANTIQKVNQVPERWALIFEEIEQQIRERSQLPEARKPKSRRKASEQTGG